MIEQGSAVACTDESGDLPDPNDSWRKRNDRETGRRLPGCPGGVLHTAVPLGPGFTLYLDDSIAQHSRAANCRRRVPGQGDTIAPLPGRAGGGGNRGADGAGGCGGV